MRMPRIHSPWTRQSLRRPIRKVRLYIEPLEGRIQPSVDVLTFHNDVARTGANLNETQLTPANVNTSTFGQLFSYPVDGQIYAQPLIKTNITIPGLGTHDVVLVATENDSVYAFDANSNSGSDASPLWHDSFTNPAAGITAVPWQPTMQGDIQPVIGITATPVIDSGTNTMYVVVKTQEVRADGTHFVQRLHALDITTGTEKFGGPALVGDTMQDGGPDGGYTDATPIAVAGTGDGSDGTTLRFNALRENNRSGLVLSGGVVYLAFGSHGDVDPYHGWVVGFSASTLKLVSTFCDTPDGGHGGIWMSGDALAVDASGNLYFAAGDGPFDANTGGSDYGGAIVKLSPTPDANGQLPVLDYFTPHDNARLSDLNLDEGSGGVLLLPDQPGPNPHLLVQAGKIGRIYLIDRDTGTMGGFNATTDNVVQALPDGSISGSYDAPAYFNNGSQQLIYYLGPTDVLKSFSLASGLLSQQPFAQTSQPFNFPGASPSISASGTQNAIVWALDTALNGTDANPNGSAVLHAYDATTLEEIYNSSQLPGTDQLGNAVKFTVPVVANGKVYIGTQTGLYVFGLLTGNPLADAGFEAPVVGSGSFKYNPVGAPWSFQHSAGLTGNHSAFTGGNPSAPEGTQVAFLQAMGSVSQTIALPAGTFNISLSAAQRGNVQASAQTFQILIDGNVVATFNSLTGISYSILISPSFTVSRGRHILTIQGTDLNGGDNTVFIDQVSINSLTVGPTEAGFESPVMPRGAFQYNPVDCDWTFLNSAGMASNNSAFTSTNPSAPEGTQVAFLQALGSMNQTFATPAGTFTITFLAAQRANIQAGLQTFQVLVDGTVVGSFNNVTGTGYTGLTTSSFILAAGNHTLAFQGTDLGGGDNTILIDQVVFNTLPAGLGDSGFENPAVGNRAFQYNPAGGAWTYTGFAGLAGNGSSFTQQNPNAPQGSQVAFMQQLGSIRQNVTFPTGTYDITISAAQRGNFQASAQTFQVLVDGTVVGTFNNLTGVNYTRLTTSSFAVTAGNHTLVFQGTDLGGGDNTVLLDQVVINLLPTGVSDSGFESPAVGNANFVYNPAGAAWSYTGFAGVAANGSTFTAVNPSAPQGNQVAFVQQLGSISQSVGVPAGTYDLTFSAAQRGNFQASAETFQVLLDGAVIGTFNNLTGTSYTLLATPAFTVAGGKHTLTFQGTDLKGGDNTVLLDQIAINLISPSLSAGGFETPVLGKGTIQYNPAGTAWTYTGSAGVSANGSAFTAGNPRAPEGNQVAFIQAFGTISQTLTLAAGTYSLTISAAQRANVQASLQTFQVLVDGVVVATFNSLTGTSYTTLTTARFSLAAGSHTLVFQGTDLGGGDNTVFLDQVLVNLMSR
jgi:hypothetical protein